MRVRRDDPIGAVGCVLVAVISVLPSLAPFVVQGGDFILALRVSNLVSFGMLFAVGWGYGRYSRMNPWQTGLLLFGAGLLMVTIAISLGK